MNILITGGNGYIGKSLSKNLSEAISVNRKVFDLTDRYSTDKWFDGKYFDIVIHTAVKGGSRLSEDNGDVCYQNLQMFYNLLNNRHCFGKLINLGSGAELNVPSNPYGISKNAISRIIDTESRFYNIRIYGVFDENELDTRFIKSNIKRYINKQPIIIHQNKLMDFFYMEDLIKLVKYYVKNTYLPKHIDCSYSYHYSLTGIADMINKLSDYKVKIKTELPGHNRYIGEYNPIIIPPSYKGLKVGIKETYKKLLNETN